MGFVIPGYAVTGRKTNTKTKSMMSRSRKLGQSNQLRRYRKQRCLRLRDIADKMGLVGCGQIHQWEMGYEKPTLTNALKLSVILQCPVEVLFLDYFHQIKVELEKLTKH